MLVIVREAVSANEDGSGERLAEPALRFAKDASFRVAEMEREWLKLAEGLTKRQADFAVADGGHSDSSLRDEATRLLGSAKKLLADSKRVGSDLERFKDTLTKSATHYREVAVLCKAQAGKARAREVKDDYLELAKVYEAKAQSAGDRAKKLSIPSAVKDKAEVIEEGNVFLERLVDALAIGPVADADRGLLAGRLRKHGERCKALMEELSRAIVKLLEDAETAEVREKIAAARKDRSSPLSAVTGQDEPRPKKALPALAGASWSTPITIEGEKYVQVMRFNSDGTCVQAVYRSGQKGRGALIGAGSATYKLDSEGILEFYQAGFLIETGLVTMLGKDQWSYEIIANIASPKLAGTRLTFTREARP
jgi:hypothetical protein